MRTLHLFLLSLASLLAASCSSEEDIPAAKQEKPIEFSTYIQNHSRAVGKTAFEDGDQIGLYACRTTGDYTNTFTSNFMNNVAVTKEASGWTYSPPAVWPNDENKHISFVAFYPKSATTSSTGLTYDFRASTDPDPSYQIDPMWCTIKNAHVNDRNGTAINGNETAAAFEATSGSVPLKFQHMLSKVKIKIKLDKDYPGITAKLTSAVLRNFYREGTFSISGELDKGSWSVTGSGTGYYIDFLRTREEPIDLSTEDLLIGETLLIPQTGDARLTIMYKHTLLGGGEKNLSKTITLNGGWQQNKIYKYVINLSLETNEISISTDIEDWPTQEFSYGTGSSTPLEIPELIDLGTTCWWANCDYGAKDPYTHGTNLGTSYYNMGFAYGDGWYIVNESMWHTLFNTCNIVYTTKNGVTGYLATAPNGNSMFFCNRYYWYPKRTQVGTEYKYYYVDLATKSLNNYKTSGSYPIRLYSAF